MRVRFLLVNRFYGSQQTPTGRMVRDVALELRRQGHQVFILATRSSYSGTAGEAVADAGIEVQLVREWGGRMLRWGIFWCWALRALASRRWDRCVLLTDPPFLPVAAWLTRIFRSPRQRVYWWTMDIYPEALVAAGMISERGWLNRCLRQLNELGWPQMHGVIALGARQWQRLQTYRHYRTEPGFARVVPPWDFRSLPRVEPGANRVLAQLRCGDKKVALYTGNLGEGHLFEPFVAAARRLQEQGRTDWQFVFAVRGAGRTRLLAAAAGLPNFEVRDYFPERLTPDLLWAATVHLVSMKPGWEGVIVPSKLYGALQTSAPVLFLGPEDADTALAIQSAGRGRVCAPGADGETVVQCLDSLAGQAWVPGSPPDHTGPGQVVEFVVAG